MKYIHHYTSIDNLALILKSKKIRFTRLDLLDDIQEISGMDDSELKLHKQIYISSWTADDEENIPLWKMYASISNGVRISLPENMFKKNLIPALNATNHGISHDYYSPFSKEQTLYNGKYLIMNSWDGKDFYKPVEYVNDFSERYSALIDKKGQAVTIKSLWDFAKYKSKKWEFQKEVRFTIYTKALNPVYKGDQLRQFDADNITQWFENPDKYIDVPLSDEAFYEMKIRIAPCATDAQKVIVNSLIQTYELKNIFEESELNGKIR